MTIQERVLEQVKALDEAELLQLEQTLQDLHKEPLSPEDKTALWRPLIGMLDDPDDLAAFEEATARRPLFDNRTLELD